MQRQVKTKIDDAIRNQKEMSLNFVDMLAKQGYDVDLIKDAEISEELASDKDLVLSFGGDTTYLSTASFIKKCSTAIIGINPHSNQRKSNFCDLHLNFERHHGQI